MARRSGLGRGLDSLIPGEDRQVRSGIQAIAVDQISPNPRQPRQEFDQDQLAELAQSIREHGVLQPLIVTYEIGDQDRYTLIAGHRRLIAARQAGLLTVPAVVREVTEQQRLERRSAEEDFRHCAGQYAGVDRHQCRCRPVRAAGPETAVALPDFPHPLGGAGRGEQAE